MLAPERLHIYSRVSLVSAGFQPDDGEERLCAFTNSLQGAESSSPSELRGVVQENGTILCSRGSRCYGLWEKKGDGEMQLLNQGEQHLKVFLQLSILNSLSPSRHVKASPFCRSA